MIEKILAYFQGNFRYKLYYSRFLYLIPKHIIEQVEWRVKVMENSCYDNGSCDLCGCTTTALQMANKSCDKPCYPPFMSKKKWFIFKSGETVFIDNTKWRVLYYDKNLNDTYQITKAKEVVIKKDCKIIHTKKL